MTAGTARTRIPKLAEKTSVTVLSNYHALSSSIFEQPINTTVFILETSSVSFSVDICNNGSCFTENNTELSSENDGLAKGLLSGGGVIALGTVTGVVYKIMYKKVKISPDSREQDFVL